MSLFQHYFAHTTPQSRLAAALAALRRGEPVVLRDDETRENEADLIVAAELITVPVMAQLIRDCSGIVCLCLPDAQLRQLALPAMPVRNGGSRYGTAFTVSIEAREGVSTGVSARDRITTTLAALSGNPAALVSPGHLFPIRAQAGGVLARRGHTEGSVDLASMAGLRPAALLCELTRDDGEMLRGDEVIRYAEQHGLVVLNVEDIVQGRLAAAEQEAMVVA